MRITYSESLQLRGLAILMMILLHCFNKDSMGSTYMSFFPDVSGVTIPYLLTRIAQICVPLYCFLSGYGLYCKYPYSEGYTKNKFFTLVKQYWFVLIIFAVIGYVFFAQYDFNFSSVAGNILAYDTTWNVTLWFLLPYILLLFLSKFVFGFINKRKIFVALPIIVVLWLGAMTLLKFEKNGTLEINVILKNVLQVFRLMLPFCMGAYCKKYENVELPRYLQKMAIVIAVLVLLTRFLVWNHFTLPIACLCFVYLYHVMPVSGAVKAILSYFGEKSLFLWFCHAYFIYYYLKDYTFAAYYALSIFLLAIIYSLVCATILEFVYKKLRL